MAFHSHFTGSIGSIGPGSNVAGGQTWGFNSLGYNWWDYAQEKTVDSKVSRIAYTLAGMLVQDRLKAGNVDISQIRVKLLDFGTDGDLASLFESIGLKPEIIKTQDIPYSILSNNLETNQIIAINSLYHGQPKEVFANLFQYVTEGGRLLIFNSAPHLVSAIFPGKVQPAPHSTCVSAKLKISVSEKEIFSGFSNSEQVILEYGRYPVEIVDKQNVKILAKINAQTIEPLLLKWIQGDGAVYLWVSRLFVKEKENEVNEFGRFLEEKGACTETTIAWQCANNVSYRSAVSYALSTFPSMELIAKVFVKEYNAIEQLQAQLQQQMIEQQASNEEFTHQDQQEEPSVDSLNNVQ
jgi:hypothetical protein